MTTSFLNDGTAVNAICPYFTMFPLEFPLNILKRRAGPGETVLDPFCGRGTTNLAARLLGLRSVGIDSSPVATAITASKLVTATAQEIIEEARQILKSRRKIAVPRAEFWRWAYHPDVLQGLCRLRRAFLQDCTTDARIALRGICLGALHGPKQKTTPSYFSNQCPRTYGPKPGYAVRYWKENGLSPEPVDLLNVIARRAKRYFARSNSVRGEVRLADSRTTSVFNTWREGLRFDWVITSPPYYGMRTYIPDQWLRNWLVGGAAAVEYRCQNQIAHSSPSDFAGELRQVWGHVHAASTERAAMVIRFGGIADRNVEPRDVIKESLVDSGWRIVTIKGAGTAAVGKRQANTFLRSRSQALAEYDVWVRK